MQGTEIVKKSKITGHLYLGANNRTMTLSIETDSPIQKLHPYEGAKAMMEMAERVRAMCEATVEGKPLPDPVIEFDGLF